MIIFIASKNPTKINSTKKAFELYFNDLEFESFSVDSGVSHTPFDEEILIGAKNRIEKLKEFGETDFYVASESGINMKKVNNKEICFIGTWTYIEDNKGNFFIGQSFQYPFPEALIERIKKGEELADIMAQISNIKDIRSKGGATEFFSKGHLNRTDVTYTSIMSALIPLINQERYSK